MMNEIEQFKASLKRKVENGMVDMKLCTTRRLTLQEIAEGSNAIDDALRSGNWKTFRFNDSSYLAK